MRRRAELPVSPRPAGRPEPGGGQPLAPAGRPAEAAPPTGTVTGAHRTAPTAGDPATALAAEAQHRRRRGRRRRHSRGVAALRPAAAPVSATQRRGALAEDRALAMLQAAGLRLVARNVASALGELDLVMHDGAVLVFVEVRLRSRPSARHVGALGSVGAAKQRRLSHTAALFLRARFGGRGSWPACRFDVVAEEGGELDWVRGAFQGWCG